MSDDLSIPNPAYRGNRTGGYGAGQRRAATGMDRDQTRLLLFAGGLGVVLAALIGTYSLVGHRPTTIPVISADTSPIRVRPQNPGGMKIDGAENDVFAGGSDTANSRLAPPAEAPDPQALHAGAGPAQKPVGTRPPEPAAQAPMAAVAPFVQPPAQTSVPPQVPAAGPVVKPSPVRPPPVAQVKPDSVQRPQPVRAQPARTQLAGPQPASPQPVSREPAVTAEAHPASAGHQPMAQLAALASEGAAHTEWQALTKRMPELLNGRQPSYSSVERDGHTYWRVRTTGFADLAQARTFCENVRAKGAGCSVAEN